VLRQRLAGERPPGDDQSEGETGEMPHGSLMIAPPGTRRIRAPERFRSRPVLCDPEQRRDG
jgi:hypothetical protein